MKPEDYKVCMDCGKEFPPTTEFFSLNDVGAGGLKRRCKDCEKVEFNEWKARYKEQKCAIDRKSHLKVNRGITEEGYAHLLLTQNGVCAICGNPETAKDKGRIRRLSVDHDHQTGKIRGLLCHKCNIGIGLFNDDIDLLASATSYLLNPESEAIHAA